jgi:hypothetical protein
MSTDTLADVAAVLEVQAASHGALELTESSGPAVGRRLVLSVDAGLLEIHVDNRHYQLGRLQRSCVGPLGAPAELSTTTISAPCAMRSATGTMLITVDCGHEPPVLAIAASVPGDDGSWVWRIDHQIQHQILHLFDAVSERTTR